MNNSIHGVATKILEADGDPINPSTQEGQASIITAIGEDCNYIRSEETATYKYYGFSSLTAWQIKRKTLATGVWEIAYEDFTGTYANFDDA